MPLSSWLSGLGPNAVLTAIGTVIGAATGAIIGANTASSRLRRELAQNRKAMQAQTFVALVDTAHNVHLSATMDVIRSLRYGAAGGPGYEEYKRTETLATQARVRDLIDFFNDLQHMVRYDYLTQAQVVSLYLSSILDCADRLLPWWVLGFRAEHGRDTYYGSLVELCNAARADASLPPIAIPPVARAGSGAEAAPARALARP